MYANCVQPVRVEHIMKQMRVQYLQIVYALRVPILAHQDKWFRVTVLVL